MVVPALEVGNGKLQVVIDHGELQRHVQQGSHQNVPHGKVPAVRLSQELVLEVGDENGGKDHAGYGQVEGFNESSFVVSSCEIVCLTYYFPVKIN